MTTISKHLRTPVALGLLVFALFGLAQVVLGGNMDGTDRWAWATNAGWVNFGPSCTGCDGVTVYTDHLEGYAWGENIGWIRLGTHTGGGTHTYANTTATDYGVNNSVGGNLSGYAWSPGVGWINFDPAGSEQVTIDTSNGQFSGYAWAENVGWIRFRGMAADSSPYGVRSTNYPTAILLTGFSATPVFDGVLLEWETLTETDNLGFNLYRSPSPAGERLRLNADLIPGQAPGSPMGATYAWLDDTVLAGAPSFYWLEALDIGGESTEYGPTQGTVTSASFRFYLPLIRTEQP